MGTEEISDRERIVRKDIGDHWTRQDWPRGGASYAVVRNEGKPTLGFFHSIVLSPVYGWSIGNTTSVVATRLCLIAVESLAISWSLYGELTIIRPTGLWDYHHSAIK